MGNYHLKENIKVYCISAVSFPDGAVTAHQKLHVMLPYTTERKYFGLSKPAGQGLNIYKAAVVELAKGELSGKDLEEMIIRKGNYKYIVMKQFRKNILAIDEAFQQLQQCLILTSRDTARNGMCHSRNYAVCYI